MDIGWEFNLILAFLCTFTAIALLFCVSRKTIEQIFIDRARAKRQAEREAATANEIYREVPTDVYDNVGETSHHQLQVTAQNGNCSSLSLSASENANSMAQTVHDMRRLSVNPASPIKSYRMNSISVPNSRFSKSSELLANSSKRESRVRFQTSYNDLAEEGSEGFEEGLRLTVQLPESPLSSNKSHV